MSAQSTFLATLAAALGGGAVVGSWARPAIAHPGYGAGRMYGPTRRGTTHTPSAIVANKLYYQPFFCESTHTFTKIGIEQTGSGTTGNARLGVFADGTGHPGALGQDCGAVSLPGSTGMRLITVSIPLVRGLNWLAVVFDAACEVHVAQSSTGPTSGPANVYEDAQLLGSTDVSGLGAAQFGAFPRSSHTYGALPGTAPAFEAGGTNIAPVICLIG